MGDREHTKQPVEEERPIQAEGLPAEEDVSETDTRDPTNVDPEQHLNRPDQPDFDPEEREQFQDPDADLPTADTDRTDR